MRVINHIEIREGHAFIRGTNKKATKVARMYVGTDYSIEEVMAHYDLSASEVHAAIAYYYDNQMELDAGHQQARQWAAENTLTMDQFQAKIAARNAKEDEAS